MEEIKLENRIDPVVAQRVIATDTEVMPKLVKPFGDQPYAVFGCVETSDGDSYKNPHCIRNRYRNVIDVRGLKGSEDIIFSATWIATDYEDVLAFAKKYNKTILK